MKVWGQTWHATTPTLWESRDSRVQLRDLGTGWRACAPDETSAGGPIPEAALQALLGPPVEVLGIWFYPEYSDSPVKYYACDNDLQCPVILRTTDGLWSGTLESLAMRWYGTPEEAFRQCLAAMTNSNQAKLQRELKMASQLRQVSRMTVSSRPAGATALQCDKSVG